MAHKDIDSYSGTMMKQIFLFSTKGMHLVKVFSTLFLCKLFLQKLDKNSHYSKMEISNKIIKSLR